MPKPGKWEEHSIHVVSELTRLNEAQKDMGDTLQKNTLILEKNTLLLEEHMRRTEAVEETLREYRNEAKTTVAKIEADAKAGLAKLEEDIEPIENGVNALKLLVKIGAGLVALISAGVGVIKLLEFFNG